MITHHSAIATGVILKNVCSIVQCFKYADTVQSKIPPVQQFADYIVIFCRLKNGF